MRCNGDGPPRGLRAERLTAEGVLAPDGERKVHQSALAELDLIEIWRYSFDRWDEHQADKYLDELGKAIQLLADSPEEVTKARVEPTWCQRV